MELKPIERLAIEQAIYSTIADDVSTKDPDNLRGQVDAEYRELFEETGAKSFIVNLQGEQVGTYSIRQSKPKPQTAKKVFSIIDKDEAMGAFWAVPDKYIEEYAFQNAFSFLEWYSRKTGEVPNGCSWGEVVTLDEPAKYLGGTLKIDAQQVAQVMADHQLDSGIVGLLEA